SLVDAESPPPNDLDGFRATLAGTAVAVEAGDAGTAARHFVDYWSGDGAFEQMPEARQGQVASSMVNIAGWAHALLSEPTPLRAFSWLGAPVLFMVGKNSPASSRGVARLLGRALPRGHVVEFEGLGHMGPVTHPDLVNAVISPFLDCHGPSHRSDLLRFGALPSRIESPAG